MLYFHFKVNLLTYFFLVYRQEGVDTNTYFPKTVTVFTPEGDNIACRTYQLTQIPPIRNNNEEPPSEKRPSITYLDCIIKGAIECKLPAEYIERLQKIPNNGQEASAELREKLRS